MNESYWQKTSQHPCFKQLNKDIKTDILIIGGGLSGISCAYQLKETDKQITVVEKDLLGCHTSGCTTAKITLLQDLIYQKLVKHYNIETAYLYYQSQKEAIKGIKDLIEKEKIDPIELDKGARKSFLIRLKRELDFEKMVCKMEGISIAPFLDAIKLIVKSYYD